MGRPLSEWCIQAKTAMLRKDNMSVTELSNTLGLQRSQVSLVLNGTYVAPKIAEKISNFLGITDVPYITK